MFFETEFHFLLIIEESKWNANKGLAVYLVDNAELCGICTGLSHVIICKLYTDIDAERHT